MKQYISVCIPTYNRGNVIKRSIMSILNQTYKNIHVFVCDNASTDNTREVVTSIKDERLEYIFFPEYKEVNYNFLRSLSCAKDDIICLYHSDDWYYPEIIEKEYNVMMKKNVGAVFAKMNRVTDEKHVIDYQECSTEISVDRYNQYRYLNEAMRYGTIFACPTMMVKKKVLISSNILNANEGMISDMNFWLAFVKQSDCAVINHPLMNYCESEEQLSKIIFKNKRTISPQFILLDKILLEEKIRKKLDLKSINEYIIRRDKEIKNTFYNNMEKYIYFKENPLTIEQIAGNESMYLELLYNRKKEKM